MKIATQAAVALLITSTVVAAQSSGADHAASASSSSSLEAQEAANRALVERLYRDFFNGRDLSVAEQIVAENYIQHNPSLPDGRAILLRAFAAYFQAAPELKVSVKRMVAEGDLVVVHSHWQDRPTDRGNAVVDIYRLENGLIAEHWDVVQPVPETAANANGMF
jgi:predicted SnoaL-like aldol condensation-catalyzing enzyme